MTLSLTHTQTSVVRQEYLKKFVVAPVFSLEEIHHWILPKGDVVYSFVVEDPETKELTDFVSFYSLPSTVLNHAKHKNLRAAYSFYNVANKTPLQQLMNGKTSVSPLWSRIYHDARNRTLYIALVFVCVCAHGVAAKLQMHSSKRGERTLMSSIASTSWRMTSLLIISSLE